MANTFGYTPEDMRRVGTTLKTIETDISGKIGDAQTAVSDLIGTGFATAVASGAYSTQFENLSKGLRDVSENLGPLGDFLTKYADAVEQMDTDLGAQLGG